MAIEYKVITQDDKIFGGKFNATKLTQVLNDYAAQGWTVKGVCAGDFPAGFGGKVRQEIVLILERTRS